jgi:hypothetical protein
MVIPSITEIIALQKKVDQRVVPLGRPQNQYLRAIQDWNALLDALGLSIFNAGIARFDGNQDSITVDFTAAPFQPFVAGQENYRISLSGDFSANAGVIVGFGLIDKQLVSMTIGVLQRGNFDIHFSAGF